MEKKGNKKLEIIVGDKSKLEVSEVEDYLNDLKPKNNSVAKKIIPKNKK